MLGGDCRDFSQETSGNYNGERETPVLANHLEQAPNMACPELRELRELRAWPELRQAVRGAIRNDL